VASFLAAAGLPAPVLEHPVTVAGTTWRLDLAWPALKVGVELQSVRWHLDRRSQLRDSRKSTALQTAGWLVLPVTSHDWRRQPTEVLRVVGDALDARVLAGVPGGFHASEG
jgi:very-short-patch-repair endonuclease